MRSLSIFSLVLVTTFGVAAAPVDSARSVLKKHQPSIVHVTAVLDIQASAGGQPAQSQEQEIEVVGTVVDKQGLVAVALSSTTIAQRCLK